MEYWYKVGVPIPWEHLTKVKGEPERHIEQLWDEIKKIKERLDKIEGLKKSGDEWKEDES